MVYVRKRNPTYALSNWEKRDSENVKIRRYSTNRVGYVCSFPKVGQDHALGIEEVIFRVGT